jgi:hypothetical protein
MSFWQTRKRAPSETVTGAQIRIVQGAFGSGSPTPGLVEVDPRASAGIYNYHEGDVFLPGTGNWVFESIFELPLITLWGMAFLRKPNTFNPIQPPQVWAQPNVVNNGIGGLQAGTVDLEGLINPEGEAAPFTGDFAIPLNVSEG